jgi:ferrous iron transport protein B
MKPTMKPWPASWRGWVWTATCRRLASRPCIDRVLLHPVAGPLLLAVLLFLVFQAVFAWAEAPMGWIEAGHRGRRANGPVLQALPEG